MGETFLQPKGNYRDLIAFQKAECIYDITHYFCHRYLSKGDRTIDQMVQAARSGKQNIVEASAAATTSSETEIKLMNVARASLHELLADYEDFLRVNDYEQWSADSEKFIAMRKLGADEDNAKILDVAKSRSLDVVANMAIVLLNQEDYLLHKLLSSVSEKFLNEGGFKEKMHSLRVKRRG